MGSWQEPEKSLRRGDFLREQENPINFATDELCHSSLPEKGWKTGIQKLDIRLLSEQAAKGFLLPTPFVKR